MLLNLGLTADAAAAHNPDPSAQLETPPAPSSPSYSSAFSLVSLPLLGGLYSKPKQADATAQSTESNIAVAMSPVVSDPVQGQPSSSSQAVTPAPPRPTVARVDTTNTTAKATSVRKAARKKTSYQIAHPASHARHKRLKLRPKLLLQLQQISNTPRPLPALDVLPSTLYRPRLARKFPAMFRGKNGLGPNDLIIVMSELYELASQKSANAEVDDHDHREVIATICQILQEDALQKGKAEICLNFGPVWEATPLPSGSYEFVARTGTGTQVMRWALRAGKNRRYSAQPSSEPREDGKRFTFSVIDPTTRQHPVIASMTRNQLEVFDHYSALVRSGTGPTTPSSNMSVISDLSENEVALDANPNANIIKIDDELRTLIIVTSVWVAFREGWSQNFTYADQIASPTKSVASPATTKVATSTANSENTSPTDRDKLDELKDVANGGKRCVSVSSMRRASTMSPVDGGKSFGSLNKRSNSTGAAFMDRVRQRSTSSTSHRFNRHSMFTNTGENGGVVSRPASTRRNSVEHQDAPTPTQSKRNSKIKPATANPKPPTMADQTLSSYQNSHHDLEKDYNKEPEIAPAREGKGKRHRFSSMFNIFHRKQGVTH
ncbi:hypothetical protein N7478_006251 [Penicillium angulare]|uniref:uncharacterized protein n=1 Tax=Penicillium angulare TaxID=116970 RepID=UPI00253FF7A8|nr:uncharacterized protein N7478_006251 [Penicillium angulare]KAJ5280879.1 hypothetical protein N7478_006251 [Penicillium angulare]